MNKFIKIFVFSALVFSILISGPIQGFAASLQTMTGTNTVSYDSIGYQIDYVLNGGTNNLSNPITYKSNSPTIVLQEPTKSNNNFAGWYDNGTFSGTVITQIVNGSSGNKTFYANWVLAESSGLNFVEITSTTYSVNDTGLPSTVTNLVVPNEHNGFEVTQLDMAGFRDNTNLESVYIEDGIVSMGSHVFRDCSNVSTIYLPNTLIDVPIHAFNGCESLTALIVPRSISQGSITTGSTQMLANTPASLKIFVPADSVQAYKNDAIWKNYANKICSMGTLFGDYAIVDVTGGVSIYQYTGNITNVVIPTYIDNKLVVAIGASAFTLNNTFASVIVPASVKSIGDSAFYYCEELATLTILRLEEQSITTAATNFLTGSNALTNIYVTSESVNAYKNATYWSTYSSIISSII